MRDNWGRRGAGTIPGGRSQRPRCCPGQLGLWEDGTDQAGMRGWALGMGGGGLSAQAAQMLEPLTPSPPRWPLHTRGPGPKGDFPAQGGLPEPLSSVKLERCPPHSISGDFCMKGGRYLYKVLPSGPSLPSCLVSCKLPGMRMSEQQDGWKRRQCWQGLQGEFSQALVPKEILSQVPPAS